MHGTQPAEEGDVHAGAAVPAGVGAAEASRPRTAETRGGFALDARALIALYLIIVTLPLGLAAIGARPPRGFWDELATGAGMLAFAIILVEFVLSGRFVTVSRKVGMDQTMRFHQLLARLALILAVLHPFLYEAPFVAYQAPWDTTRQEALLYDFWALAGGMVALILLPAFVLGAIWRDSTGYSYEAWRLGHGIGALIIAGALLHHTLTAGRYSQDPVLAGLWLVLFAGALFTLVVVYVVRPLRHLMRPWELRSVAPAGERQWALEVVPVGHEGMTYQAGQFGWLGIGKSPFSLNEHPLSFSSAPSSGPPLTFIVKELGDFTRTLGSLRPGTPAFVDGPYGNLVVDDSDAPGIAFIAGGIGIAPLLGILRELRLRGDPRPTVLVYGNRAASQIAFPEELEALEREHGTEVVLVVAEPDEDWTGRTGRLDAALLQELFDRPDRRDWAYVLCGPGPMIEAVERTLIDTGIAPARVLSERFQYD